MEVAKSYPCPTFSTLSLAHRWSSGVYHTFFSLAMHLVISLPLKGREYYSLIALVALRIDFINQERGRSFRLT